METPNPPAPPAAPAPPGARRGKRRGRYSARLAGTSLIVSHDAELPSLCMKCGAHDDIVRRVVNLKWTPMWTRFLVFCGVGILLRFIFGRRALLVAPLCAPCDRRWKQARFVVIGSTAAVVAAIFWLETASFAARRAPLAALVILLVVTVVARLAYARPRTLVAARIDDEEITLAGVAPAAAREIVASSSSS